MKHKLTDRKKIKEIIEKHISINANTVMDSETIRRIPILWVYNLVEELSNHFLDASKMVEKEKEKYLDGFVEWLFTDDSGNLDLMKAHANGYWIKKDEAEKYKLQREEEVKNNA